MAQKKVRNKFLIPAVVVLCLLTLAGTVSLYFSNKKKSNFEQISDRLVKVTVLTEEIQHSDSNLLFHLFQYILHGHVAYLESIRHSQAKILSSLRELQLHTFEDRNLEVLNNLYRRYETTSQLADEIVEEVRVKNIPKARKLFEQYLAENNTNMANLKDLEALTFQHSQSRLEAFKIAYDWMTRSIALAGLVTVAALIALLLFYEIIFLRPLSILTRKIRKTAISDFTYEIPAIYRDELGELNVALSNAAAEVRRRMAAERQLNEKLHHMNLELQNFSYVTTHDLKEPLRSMTLYVQLIERQFSETLPEKAKSYFQIVKDGCDRMNSMVNGLQALFRMDHTKNTYQPVNLEDIVRSAMDNLKSLILERKPEITYSDLPRVRGNSAQLIELFQNLIANAIKYNESDKPTIRICSKLNPDDPNTWKVFVEDNGIGFDMLYKDKIFRLFSRLHSRQNYPGSGIGLTICQKIVHQHGGELDVHSAPGKGSSFYFTIPVLEEEERATGQIPTGTLGSPRVRMVK